MFKPTELKFNPVMGTFNIVAKAISSATILILYCSTVLFAQTSPTALCQNTTFSYGISGQVAVQASDVDGGSSGYTSLFVNRAQDGPNVFSFNSLSGGVLNGQSGWMTRGWAGALPNPSNQTLVGSVGVNNSVGLQFNVNSPGEGVSGWHFDDPSFDVPTYEGNETQAYFQVDFFTNTWGEYFGPAFNVNNDAEISIPLKSGTPVETGPYIGCGSNQGVTFVTANGSVSTPLSSVGGAGWIRFKVEMDFTTDTGTVYFMNLTLGQTSFSPVPNMSNVPLGLNVGSGTVNDPKMWNSVWYHFEQGDSRIDNILFAGNNLTFNCPEQGSQQLSLLAVNDDYEISSCLAFINLNDSILPEIFCPNDTTIFTPAGVCGAPLVFNVTATDDCGIPTVVGNYQSGDTFPVGVTEVIYIATDSAGNQDSCEFDVTVIDNVLPTIDCPDDTLLSCIVDSFPVNLSVIPVSDNCPGVLPGFAAQIFQGGLGCIGDPLVFVREFIVTDAAGNIDSCTQTISIVDDIDPTITCPPDTTIPCTFPAEPAVVGFAQGVDNCAINVNPNISP